MSKNIIFMVNIETERSKTQGYQYGIESWKHYAKKYNCDLILLDQKLFDDEVPPQWYKAYVFHLLESSGIYAERILYVDCDTIIHPDAPNIFDLYSEPETFYAVRNFGSLEWVFRSIEVYEYEFAFKRDWPWYEYFNSGVMLFDKSFEPIFDKITKFLSGRRNDAIRVQNTYHVGKDQPLLNFLIREYGGKVKMMPYEWNMQDLPRFEIIGPDLLFSEYGYLYHFNCGVKPSPGEYMEYTYKTLYK